MTTLVIVRIRNCAIKFFLCPCCNHKVDVLVEHVNVFSSFPKYASYKMSAWVCEGVVHCHNLENNFFEKRKWLGWMQEIHFVTAASSLIQNAFYLQLKMCRIKKTVKNGYWCCNSSFTSGSVFESKVLEKTRQLYSGLYLSCKQYPL